MGRSPEGETMTRPAEYEAPTVDVADAAPRQRVRLFKGPGGGGGGRYIFIGIWLIYLVQPISNLFSTSHGHGHGVLYIAGGLLITAVFCGIYLPVMSNVDRWPTASQVGLAAMAVLTGLGCTLSGHGRTPLG